MKTLAEREDLSITKADKGAAVFVIDVDDYVKEANRQLDKIKFHKKLPNDITVLNRTKINTSIEELKTLGFLEEEIANNLKSSKAKSPQYYFPKIF